MQTALREFQKRIPALAEGLTQRLDEELAQNANFKAAFKHLGLVCQKLLQPTLSEAAVKELLVQHLLTERFLQSFFVNSSVLKHNLLRAEIAKVSETLAQSGFDRHVFLRELAEFYETIETNIQQSIDFTTKQALLNLFYESFLQSFATKQADTHGIIYTPQEIVDFMWNSVEVILQQEFNLALAAPTVKILDPCVGTGNFILNLLKRISRQDLQRKYENEIFCNEVLLFPYYIAALNIESCYFELMNSYVAYPGLRLIDTLACPETVEERKQTETAPLTVIIGNPPYNVGQQNENDNNKNRKYAVIDSRIRETYAKASRATNKNALSDAYIKFFRWAVDRLAGQDGIICFVSNNGFLEGIAFDGFRQHLLQDFTTIYHLNLGGNARKGGGGSVFGIMVGVSITILVRNKAKLAEAPAKATLLYHALADQKTGAEKLALLTKSQSIESLEWQILQPDAKNNWLTDGLLADFATFLPLGTKEAKAASQPEALFKTYCRGICSGEDTYVYNFDRAKLAQTVQRMIANYLAEQQRWLQQGQPKNIEGFLQVDEKVLKWVRRTKRSLLRGIKLEFDASKMRSALYRPFTPQNYYFEQVFSEEIYQFPRILPTPASEAENLLLCLTGLGAERPFTCLVTNRLPNLVVTAGFGASSQCFPFYTYAEDGGKRKENITDWAVKQFEAQYGPDLLVSRFRQAQPPLNRGEVGPGPELAEGKVSASSTSGVGDSLPELAEGYGSAKKAIFFYVYALLHHPLYRERYQENLKRELPRLPLVGDRQTFLTLVDIGQKLADLHLNYETVEEYPLEWVENQKVPWTWRVEKMKLTKEKDSIIVNHCLTLKGIPASAFEYQLGNRSALEWVLDQYQTTTDKRSGITNDPNQADEPQYIVRLIGKVITVSVETVKLVKRLREIRM